MTPSPPPNVSPKDLFEQARKMLDAGDVWGAATRAGTLRKNLPDDPPVMALNGYAYSRLGMHLVAIPDMRGALHMTERALEEGDPENPAHPRIVEQKLRLMTEIGRSLADLGELHDALESIDEALEIEPDRVDSIIARAEVLARHGRGDDALADLDDALGRKLDELPLRAAAARVLADHPEPDDAAMDACAGRLGELCDQVGLGVGDLAPALRALARLLDRMGRHAEAFRTMRRAARLRYGSFDAGAYEKAVDAIIRNWTADEIARLVRPDERLGEKRIFLGGSVKSGVPRLERALEWIPNTFSLGPAELMGVLAATHFKTAQTPLRRVVASPAGIRGEQLSELARGYINQATTVARLPDLTTIDTHPHNALHFGLAAAAMPGVCIIQCRRDPMAHTLDVFADEMPGNHAYAGDLMDTASFIHDTNRLMDHWREQLTDERVGARVIDVDFEEIMNAPGAVVERVAGVLGVDLAPDMLAGLEPEPIRGPGAHADAYASHLRPTREIFEPTSQGA